MTDIRIDDDGFLVGDGEQTDAENVLIREIKTDTTTIVNLLKGTVKLQRDALKAAQSAANPKPKGNAGGQVQGAGSSSNRVSLNHPNRPSQNGNNSQGAPLPPTLRPNRSGAENGGSPNAQPNNSGQPAPNRQGTDRVNRRRGANGRFSGEGGASDVDSSDMAGDGTQGRGNRDSRGRFTGDGSSAAERSAASRITDGLKDLSHNLTLNANTEHIDPMIDAIKEAGDVVNAGVDASKKVLSVGNTLVAKPVMALGRGIKGLFKPKTDAINSPVAWYKRIWKTLVLGNRQDHADHNAEQRRLDELARGQNQGGGGSGGMLIMLGLALLAALAAFKNFKFPSWLTGQDNSSPNPVIGAPKVPPRTSVLPPTRNQSRLARLGETKFGKFVTGLSETKIGKALGGLVKKIPLITSLLELGAGGINAVNINNDKELTDAQKERAQSANAGRTGGAIAGGFGGTAAGAALGTWMIPIPILGTVIGGLVGSWLGTEGGKIVGNAIGGWVDDLRKSDIAGRISNAWSGFIDKITPSFSGLKESIVSLLKPKAEAPIDILKNPPTKKMTLGGKSVPIVGDIYSDKDSELYKNYQKWREADTTGKGIITLDDFKKSKYVKQNPNLLKQFDAVSKPTTEKAAKGLTTEKAKTIEATAKRLGVNPNDLAQIISFETGGTFDPSQKNLAGGKARGLIQFMPDTAMRMGTTTEALAAMSFDEQMLYVEKYLKQLGIGKDGKVSKADMYNAVLGSGYKQGSKEYAANPDLDVNKNGVIEKGEAVKSKKFMAHEKTYFATAAPKPQPLPTSTQATSAVPTIKAAPVTTTATPNVQAIQSVQAKEQPQRLSSMPQSVKVSMPKPLVGQNVSDRGIAHILTGGIGES